MSDMQDAFAGHFQIESDNFGTAWLLVFKIARYQHLSHSFQFCAVTSYSA